MTIIKHTLFRVLHGAVGHLRHGWGGGSLAPTTRKFVVVLIVAFFVCYKPLARCAALL